MNFFVFRFCVKKLKMETLVADSNIQIPDICKLSIIPESFAGIQTGSIIDVAPSNTLKNATTVCVIRNMYVCLCVCVCGGGVNVGF